MSRPETSTLTDISTLALGMEVHRYHLDYILSEYCFSATFTINNGRIITLYFLKSLLTDVRPIFSRSYSYFYWNWRGVRVTPESFVHRDAKIAFTCSFYRKCIVSHKASINHFTYAINASIENAHVGKFCSIAPDSLIGPNNHPTNLMSTHPMTYNEEEFNLHVEPAIIGHDVWIGAKAIILAGVKVPDGCVVAAGAVVTKTPEPYTIIGGVPARIIGKRSGNREFVSLISQTDDPYELRRIASKIRASQLNTYQTEK